MDVLLSRSGESTLICVVRAKVVWPRAVGSVRSGRGPSAEGARWFSSRAAVWRDAPFAAALIRAGGPRRWPEPFLWRELTVWCRIVNDREVCAEPLGDP